MKSSTLTRAAAGVAALIMTNPGLAVAQPASQAIVSPAPDSKIGPRLSVEPSSVEFGQIGDVSTVRKTVTLTNTGDQAVEIPEENGVRGSCGCTVPKLEKNVLEPGESMEIEVAFNPVNRNGVQNKTVTINSNAEAPTVIPVNATIIQRVQVVEGIAQMGRIDQGDSHTIEINIRGLTGDFEVLDVSVDRPDAYRAEIIGQSLTSRDDPFGDGQIDVGQTTVAITLLDDAPVGRIDSMLSYSTNDAEDRQRQLRIAGSVVGDLRLDQGGVRLGLMQPGDDFEQSVVVYSHKGNEFNVPRALFVSSDLSPEDRARISATVEPLPIEDVRTGFRVTLAGDVSETMRLVRGRLVIMTDRPGQKVISAAVQGVVRAAR
ncbi:MAG: DUF1573 domain-containing protein [Planctomycetota bacterium]